MTDDATNPGDPAGSPSAPRGAGPEVRPSRGSARSRAADWLRGFWYGFQRLFGLDSCPIEQGPGGGRPPGPPSPTGRAHHASSDGGQMPGVRSDRGS